eukprot:1162009-Pelagomonas_calceolata.AAC.4
MSIVFAIRRARGGELGGSLKAQRILLAWSIVSHCRPVKCLSVLWAIGVTIFQFAADPAGMVNSDPAGMVNCESPSNMPAGSAASILKIAEDAAGCAGTVPVSDGLQPTVCLGYGGSSTLA